MARGRHLYRVGLTVDQLYTQSPFHSPMNLNQKKKKHPNLHLQGSRGKKYSKCQQIPELGQQMIYHTYLPFLKHPSLLFPQSSIFQSTPPIINLIQCYFFPTCSSNACFYLLLLCSHGTESELALKISATASEKSSEKHSWVLAHFKAEEVDGKKKKITMSSITIFFWNG